MSTKIDTEAPPGVGDLPGVADLYEAYAAAKAAKAENPTRATADASSLAQANLARERTKWRGIRDWANAVAIAEWRDANPEAAAAVDAEQGK